MFKFGDKVIHPDIKKNEGVIMATGPIFATVMFETKHKILDYEALECRWDIHNTNSTYAYAIPKIYLQKVEPEQEKSQHNNDNFFGDRIAVAVDGKIIYNSDNSINPEKEKITITGEAKFSGEHAANLTEPLKEATLNLTNKSLKKRKPNKLRKLIKKIVKTEIKKLTIRQAKNE